MPVYSVLYDRPVKESDAHSMELSDCVLKTIESLVSIIIPPQVATRAVSAEYYPTLGHVYPNISGLVINHLKYCVDNSGTVKTSKPSLGIPYNAVLLLVMNRLS